MAPAYKRMFNEKDSTADSSDFRCFIIDLVAGKPLVSEPAYNR
jgi:hypothetical protein